MKIIMPLTLYKSVAMSNSLVIVKPWDTAVSTTISKPFKKLMTVF